ncbi:MAG: GNAT family N-acetyltransferase [Runella sp.]
MNFRTAQYDDFTTIAHLHTTSWQHHYRGFMPDDFLDNELIANRLEVWQKRLAQPTENQYIILAEIQNEVVGFCCAYANAHPQWGTYIDNLHVLPHFKAKGIGRRLMQQIADWSTAIYHQPNIHLHCIADNRPARGFYEKVGGVCQEVFKETLLGGKTLDVCRYVWPNFNG